jgi:hypothetical protein
VAKGKEGWEMVWIADGKDVMDPFLCGFFVRAV